MLIATFGPSTAWVGKTIEYDGAKFVLEGYGPVAAQAVLDYDRQGHLVWTSAQSKELVAMMATSQAPASMQTPVAAAGPPTVRPLASPMKKPVSPVAVAVIVAAVVILAIIGIAAAASSSHDAAQQAGGAAGDAGQAAAAKTLVTVFTWPGGGADNDIRNSQPFQLAGGHQVVTVTSAPAGPYTDMTTLGWTLESSDSAGEMEMLNPASTGTVQSDFYLPAGSYFLSSNTIAATWTVTVAEMR